MVRLNRFWLNRQTTHSVLSLFYFGGLLFFITACIPAANHTAPESLTGVYGLVTNQEGSPVSDAFIYAYRVPSKNMRGPADYAIRTELDGSYILDLPSEPFHLIARYRQAGDDSGPPRQGDIWAPSPLNPVIIKRSQPIKVDFVLSASTTPLLQTIVHLRTGSTGFSGTVTASDGKPLRDIEVLAYADSNIQRVPDFRGDSSDSEGQFKIVLPEEGQFCLVLRERIKGQPRSSELFALIKGEGGCLSTSSGQIRSLGEISLQPYGSR